MSHCPVDYPTLPQVVPCFREVISVYNSGKLYEEMDHVAKHLWAIQGAVQNSILGDPDLPPVVGDAPIATMERAMEVMEAATPDEDGSVKAVSPWLLLKVIAFIYDQFREKKLAA